MKIKNALKIRKLSLELNEKKIYMYIHTYTVGRQEISHDGLFRFSGPMFCK